METAITLKRVRAENFRAYFGRHIGRQLRLSGRSWAADKEGAPHSMRPI
jgi:hypothetical protein